MNVGCFVVSPTVVGLAFALISVGCGGSFDVSIPSDGGANDSSDGNAPPDSNSTDAGVPDAKDGGANESSDGSSASDSGSTTGLTIGEVAARDITQTTANITWDLNEPGTGQVEYGTTTAYGNTSKKEISFRYSAHVQALSGLSPTTLYHFRVRSSDQAGVEVVSEDYAFTTAGPCDGVTCSGHGICQINAGEATCTCEDGYYAAGLTCVANTSTGCAKAPTSTLLVNVRDTGAKGDGITDDTESIQTAVDRVGGTGGTVLIPNGTYLIDAIVSVDLKANMTFRMESGAVLKAIPNASGHYAVLRVPNVSGVTIVGGTLQGERHQHRTPGNIAMTTPRSDRCTSNNDCYGQWGMGIATYGASNLCIDSVIVREFWGDGIYLAGSGSGGSKITISRVTADDNRRQGLSIISGDDIFVHDSTFSNTIGHNPQSGIDIEPNDNQSVINVRIENSRMIANRGSGLTVNGWASHVVGITIQDNEIIGIMDDPPTGGDWNSLALNECSEISVLNNNILNKRMGIVLSDSVSESTFVDNVIEAPTCIKGGTASANTFRGNLCK